MNLPLDDRSRFSQDIVQRATELHRGDLAAAVTTAWRRYGELKEVAGKFVVDFDWTTKANIIHDLTVLEARRRFEERADEGITVREVGKEYAVLFAGPVAVAVRFKKLNRNGVPVSYRTRRQRERDRQLRLPGMPETIEVVLGYLVGRNGLKALRIVLPFNRERNHWQYDVPIDRTLLARTVHGNKDAAGGATVRRRKAQ